MKSSKFSTPIKLRPSLTPSSPSSRGNSLLGSPSAKKQDPDLHKDLSRAHLASLDPPFDYLNPRLRSLDLSHNLLSSLPDVFLPSASSLQRLDLSRNAFPEFPQQLFALAALTSLDLSHNALALLPPAPLQDPQPSTLPHSWACLSLLQRLDLSHNPSLHQIEPLRALSQSLHILSIAHCPALAPHLHLPDFPVFHLAQLRSLDLSGLSLRVLPDAICRLTQLQLLYLNDNLLVAFPAAVLAALPHLREIQLLNNRLHHLTPALAQFLRVPQLAGNPILNAAEDSPPCLSTEDHAAALAQKDRDAAQQLHEKEETMQNQWREKEETMQNQWREKEEAIQNQWREKVELMQRQWDEKEESMQHQLDAAQQNLEKRQEEESLQRAASGASAEEQLARISQLTAALSEAQQQLRDHAAAAALREQALQVQLETERQGRAGAEAECRAGEAQRALLEEKLARAEEELESSESTMKTTELINARLEEAIVLLRDHQKQTEAERAGMLEKLSAQEEENKSLRQEMTQVQAQLDQAQLKEHQEEKEGRKTLKMEQLNSLQDSLSAKDAVIAGLEAELEQRDARLEQMQRAYKEKLAKKEEKIRDWIVNLAELTKSLEATQKELEATKANLATAQEQNAALESRVFELQQELGKAGGAKRPLPSARQFRAASCRRDPSSARLPKAGDIQGELNVALDEIDSCKTRLVVAEEQLEIQKNTIVNLTDHVHKLEEQYRTMQQHAQQSSISSFFSSGPSASAVITTPQYLDLLGRFQSELSENHALKDQIVRLRKENDDLKVLIPSTSSSS